MKNFIKIIIDIIARLLSLLFSFNIISALRYLKSRIFTQAAKKVFGSFGKGLSLHYQSMLIGAKNIFIGDNFISLHGLRIETYEKYLNQVFTPRIEIGNNVICNTDCHFGCINHIRIGNNVLIASKVFITDHFHGKMNGICADIEPRLRPLVSRGPVIIEDNVWLGEGCVIMPGVTIGRNSVIGANAVVTKNVSANSVAAGIPAVVIKVLN